MEINLKALRNELGLTLHQAEALTGVPKTNIERWEKKNAGIDFLNKLLAEKDKADKLNKQTNEDKQAIINYIKDAGAIELNVEFSFYVKNSEVFCAISDSDLDRVYQTKYKSWSYYEIYFESKTKDWADREYRDAAVECIYHTPDKDLRLDMITITIE